VRIELQYFKPSGKYYSSGYLKTDKTAWFEVIDEVKDLTRQRELPGLTPGHSEFIVHMDHPDFYPAVIPIGG